jgi:hypothetical protein
LKSATVSPIETDLSPTASALDAVTLMPKTRENANSSEYVTCFLMISSDSFNWGKCLACKLKPMLREKQKAEAAAL